MSEHLLPEPPSVDFLSCVSRAQRSLYAFILTLVRQSADAEDVLQETNVILWQKAAEFDATRPFTQLHRITLPKRWMQGLWRLEQDSALHFRYKMTRPGWFHIMMGVRSDDLNPAHIGNYEVQSSFWKKGEPDQWQTVSVPFSAFRKNIRGAPYAELPPNPPRAGDVVYLLWFNTGDGDRGLVIDRIWVDRSRSAAADAS
jgi:hypothetical protein